MELYELEEARNDVLDALEDGYITMEDAEDMISDIDLLVEASKEEADFAAKIGRYRREDLAARRHRTLSEPKGSDYEKYKKDIRKNYSNDMYDGQSDLPGIENLRGQKPNADDPKAPHKYRYSANKDRDYDEDVYRKYEREHDNESRNRERYGKLLRRKAYNEGYPYSYIYKELMNASKKHDDHICSKAKIGSSLVRKVKDGKITGANAEKIKKIYPEAFKESAYEVLDNIHSFLEEAYND